MANIKSAKKRILVIETKTMQNKMIKSKLKTLIKKVDAAVAAGDKTLAARITSYNVCYTKLLRLPISIPPI